MRFAIHIDDMTAGELAVVAAFLESLGARTVPNKTVAELATAAGATPAPVVQGQDPFSAPAPGPQVPPPAGTLDSRGLPHNPQFYAESKRQNGDGSWAKRKGVDKEACEAWEASYPRGTVPQPPTGPSAAALNAQFAPGLPPQGVAPTPPPAPPLSPVTGLPPAPTTPGQDPFSAPVTPPAPPPAPVVEELKEVTYAQWHQMYMNLMTAGKITPEKYSEIAQRYGAVENVMTFSDNADARNRSYREFEALAAA